MPNVPRCFRARHTSNPNGNRRNENASVQQQLRQQYARAKTRLFSQKTLQTKTAKVLLLGAYMMLSVPF